MDWQSISDEELQEFVQSGLNELKRREISTRGMRQKALVKARRETATTDYPARLAIIEALGRRSFFYYELRKNGFTLSLWEKEQFGELRLYLRGGINLKPEAKTWTIIYFYTGNPWQGAGEVRCEGDFSPAFHHVDPNKLKDFFRLICDRWLSYMVITTAEHQNATQEPDANALAQYEEALAWLPYAPGYLKELKESKK